MKRTLRSGLQRIEVVKGHRRAAADTILTFPDVYAARAFLLRFASDPWDMDTLRQILQDAQPFIKLGRVDNREVVRQLAHHLVSGRIRLSMRREVLRYGSGGTAPPVGDRPETETPETPPPETDLTWIRLQVVHDRTDQPLPGIALAVTLPDGSEGAYRTGAEGWVDIENIPPGTCSVACAIDGAWLRDVYAFVAMGYTPVSPSETPSPSSEAATGKAEARTRIALIKEHKVRTGESLKSIAEANGLTWQVLAEFNWGTAVPDEINEHLRDEVGCTKKTPDGYNYVFDDTDEPGILYIPKRWMQSGLATEQVHVIRVRQADGFRIILENEEGLRIPNAVYKATLADGSTHEGRLGRSGIALIKDPPPGPVEVIFADLDDIEAKSLAATVRKGFDERTPREAHRLFRYPPETVRRVFEAYDAHFNDYHGTGLRHDIEQEFFTDPDAHMVFFAHLARAHMTNSEA